jgi:tetratricopeptide (TPR) repeat protein
MEIARAVRLLSLGEHFLAERTANIGLRLHPNDGALRQIRGIARHHLHQFREAADDLEVAMSLIPLSALAMWCLADAYRRTSRRRHAFETYAWLIGRKDCPPGLLSRSAVGLGHMGEDELALSACEALVANHPESPIGHGGMAYYMSRLGYAPKTILPRAIKACELAPTNADFRAQLGILQSAGGNHVEARCVLGHVHPDTVGCPHLATRIARAFENSGDPLQASTWWTRAINLTGGKAS